MWSVIAKGYLDGSLLQMERLKVFRYLCYYAQENVNFRLAELYSIAKLLNVDLRVDTANYSDQNPFVRIGLPDEESAVKILSRSVLIRSIIDVWAQSTTYTDLFTQLKNLSEEKLTRFYKDDYTFSIRIESFNKKVPFSQQKDLLMKLDFLPFGGSVKLKQPDFTFYLLQDFGDDCNQPREQPSRLFFGRLVSIVVFTTLSLVSANEIYYETIKLLKENILVTHLCLQNYASLWRIKLWQVRPGSLIYDPFVGTGSITLACAHFGAFTLGADIDPNILHGRGRSSRAKGPKFRGPDENVYANYCQYKLQSNFVDVMVLDAAKPAWKDGLHFDAIVTDPPYGIREGARKVLSKSDGAFAKTSQYNLSKVYKDLLSFAAKHLRMYGRLVFWLPFHRPSYTDELIPKHPCLTVTSNSEQVLNSNIARRLITMEKTKTFHNDSITDHTEANLQRLQDSFRDFYFKLQ
ncbi:tRNA (guanine(10)-N2)-methyltransferase-like protein [Trichoplax sp. H2]|nr:tRNA (guanine(10)-N2)-methyltransferase-like protein [Trichoplax sp. H2]|eukprot:RDD44719.1 tRNA (guanine(10)-N2)-methyltransferase-like protein [Trichoplax sp. H2]